jgi:hypothetical protein
MIMIVVSSFRAAGITTEGKREEHNRENLHVLFVLFGF